MAVEAEQNRNVLMKNLVPLNALSDEHLGQLISRISVERAAKGEFLFREGDMDHQHIYLLEGRIALLSGNREMDTVQSGSNTARFALAHQWPRKFSARATTEVRFVRIESRLLSDLLVRTQSQSYQVSELESEADEDWMSRVLRSRVLQQIPPSNIQNVLRRMEEVTVPNGTVVVRQGDPGDYYYVVVQGSCVVSRAINGTVQNVAVLGPGDGFGEEALISGSTRGGTVTMNGDGVLMRLSKDDFVELIRRPLLRGISLTDAKTLVARGALWLDVRPPDQFITGHLPDALNLPLGVLRERCGEYAPDVGYVIYGEQAGDTAIAAFLLRERGFEVWVLEGGLAALSDEVPGISSREESSAAANSATVPVLAADSTQVLDLERQLRDTQARYHKALYQRVAEIRQLRVNLDQANAERARLEQALKVAQEEIAQLRQGGSGAIPAPLTSLDSQVLLEQRIAELRQELDEAQEVLQEASAEESSHQWERLRWQSRAEMLEHSLVEQKEINRVLREENEQALRRMDALRAELLQLRPDATA